MHSLSVSTPQRAPVAQGTILPQRSGDAVDPFRILSGCVMLSQGLNRGLRGGRSPNASTANNPSAKAPSHMLRRQELGAWKTPIEKKARPTGPEGDNDAVPRAIGENFCIDAIEGRKRDRGEYLGRRADLP